MKKLATLTVIILLALCLCHSALGDVGKGDRGEEVKYLQWLLIQTGYLSGSADGAFGPKTEQAVIDYQTAKGLEPTGIADAALMLEIDRDRVRMDKDKHGQDYYQPYPGNYQPEQVASASATSSCGMTVLPGIAYQNSCERHLALSEQTREMIAAGDALSVTRATELWQADLAEQLTAAGAPFSVVEAWAAAFAAQRDALNATLADAAYAEQQALTMAQNCAQALCEALSGGMPDGADMDSIGMNGGAHCEKWSISADRTFITACDAHSALFESERGWIDAGALQTGAAAWDGALDALYADWAARTNGGAAAVEAARAAFAAALAAQDEAFPDAAALGHMRIAQLESARLCEMAGTIAG